MHRDAVERRVSSAGLELAVREHSPAGPGKAHVILVHGYPDQQESWDPLVASLDLDRLHVVTYDVRGAGRSGTPTTREGYRTELLVEDLVAVTEATVPRGERFHLAGHDWGSVQMWDVLTAEPHDDRLRGRVASFTSISGPPLDHVGHLLRRSRGRRLAVARQLAHSWYVYAFHVPVLPELLWRRRSRLVTAALTWLDPDVSHAGWGPDLGRNAANGLNLYRANVLRRVRRPGGLHTEVPVLVVVPTRDRYVRPVAVEGLGAHCTNLRLVRFDAGHWVTRSHAGEVAALVEEHVHAHS